MPWRRAHRLDIRLRSDWANHYRVEDDGMGLHRGRKKRNELLSLVQLYKALGGGWQL